MKRLLRVLLSLVLMGGLMAFSPGVRADDPPTAPILRIETGMHTAPIRACAVDASNRFLVTCSDDKTLRLWDARTGNPLRVMRPPIGSPNEGTIYSTAISPDGSTIACAGYTGFDWDQACRIYIFDCATGNLAHSILNMPDAINTLAFSPNGHFLAAGFSSGGIRVFSSTNWAQTGQDADYQDRCQGLGFGLTDRRLRLASTCYDGHIRLYDVGADGAIKILVKAKSLLGDHPFSVAFSPNGNRLAIGYRDDPVVNVVSAADLTARFKPDLAGITGGNLLNVCWSVDGRMLYAGGSYGPADSSPILCWSEGGSGSRTQLTAAEDTVLSLAPRKAGGLFFASADATFGAYDEAGNAIFTQKGDIGDFRGNLQRFCVDETGDRVQFAYLEGGKAPATVSISQRSISPLNGDQASGLTPPIQAAEGLDVEKWYDDTHPTLNGNPIKLDAYENSRSIAFTPDKKSFVLGTEWNLRYYGSDGAQLWQVATPGIAWAVNVTGDAKKAVAAFSDGTIRWYRMSDGAEILAFFPLADQKRWVTWTPSGYYDCSPGGEDLIGLHVNRGKDQAADYFSASRFRDQLYRPDVVHDILSTLDEAKAVKEADVAAGREPAEVNISAKLPPVVTILSPQSGEAVASDTLTVRYIVRTPSGEPATGVRALVDGRPAGAPRSIQLVSVEGQGDSIAVMIPHQDCTVSLIADNQYASSEAATVRLVWKGAAPASNEFVIKPKLYVLAVGVSNYDDPSLRLEYPAKDARDFAAEAEAQNGLLYREVDVKLLTDDQATKGNIEDGLDWIQHQTTSNDVAMIFLSGHGADDSNGSYFYVPVNFDRDRVKRTSLPFSDIKNTVYAIAGKALFFIDTCHAGGVMGSAKTRGMTDITAVINELASAENGVVVFTASTGSQVALEDEKWGNGAFTKAVIEGMQGKADYGRNGRITVNMLDLYISERVKQLTAGAQTPTTTKPPTVPDFPVVVLK